MAPPDAGPPRDTGPPGDAGPPGALGAVLDELGLEYENPEPGAFLLRLEGQHKLATMTWLIVGQHSL